MSVEYNNPKNVSEMRLNVVEWLENRPTIKHTQESLIELLNSEVAELNDALLKNKPVSEVTLEVGDVFFSALALDTGTSNKNLSLYSKISEYSQAVGINLPILFKKTWKKNSINYPLELFNEMSPFIDPKDAISCLRVLRNHFVTQAKLDDYYFEFDQIKMIHEPFFDGYVQIGKFRKFIKKTLIEISKESVDIPKLISKGKWDMEPLKIPGNQLNWHIW